MVTLDDLVAKANSLALAYHETKQKVVWENDTKVEQIVFIVNGVVNLNHTTHLENTGSVVSKPRRLNGVLSMINPHSIVSYSGDDNPLTLEYIKENYPVVYDKIQLERERTKAMFNTYSDEFAKYRINYQLHINTWRRQTTEDLLMMLEPIAEVPSHLPGPKLGQLGKPETLIKQLTLDISTSLTHSQVTHG